MDAKNCKNTIDWFMFISGITDIELAIKHCVPAVDSLQVQVISQKFKVDKIPQLYYAAASLAFYHYTLGDNAPAPIYFDAGDVTVRMSERDKNENAKALLESALLAARPFLKSGKIFKSIGGGI